MGRGALSTFAAVGASSRSMRPFPEAPSVAPGSVTCSLSEPPERAHRAAAGVPSFRRRLTPDATRLGRVPQRGAQRVAASSNAWPRSSTPANRSGPLIWLAAFTRQPMSPRRPLSRTYATTSEIP